MSKKVGLFTRTELVKAVASRSSKAKPQELSAEACHRAGFSGVRDMNPTALSPNMDPEGSETPDIYVLGEYPTETDDVEGGHFVGASGKVLRLAIPGRYSEKVRFNFCVRTRPRPNIVPEFHHIECFRPEVEADLLKSKPRVVIGVGSMAAKWILGNGAPQISVGRGRSYPCRIDGHSFWFCPVISTTTLAKQRENVDYAAQERMFKKDIQRACRAVIYEPPVVIEESRFFDGITLATDAGVNKTIEMIEAMNSLPYISVDIETSALRPYGSKSRILTIALGTYKNTLSIPLHHPQTPFVAPDIFRLERAIWSLLANPSVQKIAHNTIFELEWFLKFGNLGTVFNSPWHDTMTQAYLLDERLGAMNLGHCCLQEFGINLKDFSDVDRAKLETVDLKKVLLYNALDTKFTYKLFKHQELRLKDEGLTAIYNLQVKRLPTLALAQAKGLEVDPIEVKALQDDLQGQISSSQRMISLLPEVKRYEDRFGTFNPGSPKNVEVLLRDVLGRTEGAKANGKYGTDESVLELVDTELSRQILALRKLVKRKSTYIDTLDPKDKGTIIHEDWRIHCIFNPCKASTGRLSCDSPNMQNWPKRDPIARRVRKAVVAGSGNILIAVDYGQLEARVIAMASKDPVLVDYIRQDRDIHYDWAKLIYELWPQTVEKRYPGLPIERVLKKEFRSDVKNEMVFPAFFNSSQRSIARSLELPESVASELFQEFWKRYKVVKRWQRTTLDFYEQTGYVSCLTGRRRRFGKFEHGYPPMGPNDIVNSGIQGTASDIVVTAMDRLAFRSVHEDKSWLAPVLNVHDDLTFAVPKRKEDEAFEIIIEEMTKPIFDWINVPLQIEVSTGINWYEMSDQGKFSSDKKLYPYCYR